MGERRCRAKHPPPDSDPFNEVEFGKLSLACQANSRQLRVAASSSIKAVSFSSARTTKIVRPLESTAETQPQLQPALLRLSAMISQHFIRGDSACFPLHTAMTK